MTSSLRLAGIDAERVPIERSMKLARLSGFLIIFDLLLLPYFQLVILPFSLPLLCFAIVIFGVRIRGDRYAALALLLVLVTSLSAAAPFFLPGTLDYISEDFKRVIQLCTSLLYFFYFRWLAERTDLRLTRLVWVFILWFGALSVAFLLRPSATGEFIRMVYGRLVTSEDTLEQHLRFSYLFTDPNTAAYFLLVASSVVLSQRASAVKTILIVGVLACLTFFTQSRGAIIALMLMVLCTLYPPNRFGRSLMSAKKALMFVLVGLVLLGGVLYLKTYAHESTGLAKLAYERLFESPEQYSSGGSRFTVWKRFSGDLLPLPLGRGYTLKVEGAVQGTHSDLLRILYSHGLLAVVPAIMFLFSRLRSFSVLVIPALMAFAINSLLDEQKLLALFLSLLAIKLGTEARIRREREGDLLEA
jgi:O-Antigen ligase